MPLSFKQLTLHRLNSYAQLVRLDKPIGILLLLWPTLWALWLAGEGSPPIKIVIIFALGTILMRSAGCAINDWADRHIDPKVQRTKLRPLAIQAINPWEALLIGATLAVAALWLAWPLNQLALVLTIPAVLVAISYPFFKRFFPLPQAYLGLAFSFGIPMAYAAVQNTIPPIAWWLCLLNALWVFAYDTIYALVDRPDDAKIGIYTSALTLGAMGHFFIGLAYALFLIGMLIAGWYLNLRTPYYVGLAGAASLSIWYWHLLKRRDPNSYLLAFRMNHWLGAVIFLGIIGQYQLR